jgi:hypothetical protein
MIRRKTPINTTDLELYRFGDNKPHFEYIDYAQRQRYQFTIAEFSN